ncbi:hypothetical protein HRbin25_00866 [bacterium HR25]|nr:hypothetical protein HRbin25_00866 [bacterium HR25]
MQPPHGVVVGDGATGLHDGVGGGLLQDLVGLPQAAPGHEALVGVVRSGAVRVHMGEAAVEAAPPADLPQGAAYGLPHLVIELRPAVPGDGALHRVHEEPQAGRQSLRYVDEGVAPGTHGALAAGGLARVRDEDGLLVHLAAAGAGDVQRHAHGPLLGQLCRLEADDEEGPRPVQAGRLLGQLRVEEAEVGRPQLGLDYLARRLVAPFPGGEGDACSGPVAGPRLDAHPGLGDDPQDALAPQHQAVRAGTGAAPGQPTALPPSLGGEHPHRLHEVIDVGILGGVVAPGAGGDPAPQRGAGEALREVAQGEAVGP